MKTLNSVSLHLLKYFSLVAVDAVAIPLSLWLALSYWDGHWYTAFDQSLPIFIALTLFTIPAFTALGLYRIVIRYAGLPETRPVLSGVAVTTGILAVLAWVFPHAGFSMASVAAYAVVVLVLVGGTRVVLRQLARDVVNLVTRKRVAIYGAGESGRLLARMLRGSEDYRPVLFLDDDVRLQGREVAGIMVFNPASPDLAKMLRKLGVVELLLSVPSASRDERNLILGRLEPLAMPVRSVPDLNDIVAGKAKLSQLEDVHVDDLLGRESVPGDPELMSKCITGKTVLVTGAGGSIGSELCRQVLALKPRKLLLFERSEFALYNIEQELSETIAALNLDVELIHLLGSVTNKNRLHQVFSAFSVDTVYHAAAYKHVPLVEHNPVEGLWNNTFGTLYTAQAAKLAGVRYFVLISTDKAVRPTSVMGASKRLAEMVLQALMAESSQTTFSMVRFGNVLDSSGSVVPRFRKQIAAGGPVTVTHPDITRYFMTIPEAVALVIQAGAMARGGDVFVLHMGAPVRIMDLARQMVHLSGYQIRDKKTPHGDIAIEFTGLRPGEKLFEELLIGDNVSGTEHAKIMRAEEEGLEWSTLNAVLQEMRAAVEVFDLQALRQLLMRSVKGYQPQGDIEDLVWTRGKTLLETGSDTQRVIPFKVG
ncbi:MAG: polysaccharide biosynthesis protein [bacterium]